MKSNIKKVLFTLVILLLFSSMCRVFSNEEINHIEFYEENPNQINQSGFWNFIGTTISIDNNWTAVNATYDWCTGEGTESEPYIIENVTIYSQASGSCIDIQNSNDYFIIQNCSLYNSNSTYDAGITLNNVTNGKLINNYCYSNYYGIYLYESDNNTVSGNTASYNNYDGISLWSSSYNNIFSGNVVSYNNYSGITLTSNSDNNTVSGNTVSNNNDNGICSYNSNNNTVSGNNASYSKSSGIELLNSINNMVLDNTANHNNYSGIHISYSNDNAVSENTANYNNYGIDLSRSDNNMVSGNTVSNNNENGIYADTSDDNTIFLNNFTNNEQNAKDDGANNMWDNGSIGNYWDDYQGVDANNDSIGDTPYLISGSPGNQDNFPIWTDFDGIAPFIAIIFPLTDSVFGLVAPNYNISIDELNLDTIWYTLDGGGTNYTITSLTGILNQTAWEALSEGNVTIRFYANNTTGNIGSAAVTIKKDINSPFIAIIFPLTDSVFGLVAPNYNISIDELNLDTIWYTLDGGGTNYTITSLTGTFNQTAWEALSEGSVTIRFCANDTAGNLGFIDVDVIVEIPEDQPIIPFGNYFLLFTIIAVLSLTILEKQKKKYHLR